MVKVLNDSNFQQTIESSTIPVIVDFYADWCGPCRMAAPIVEQISEELEGKALVCKINVDQNPETAMAFNVQSIPCFVSFVNGKLANRQVGFGGKEAIKNLI